MSTWKEIPADVLLRATEKFFSAAGDAAGLLAQKVDEDPIFLQWLVDSALSHQAMVLPENKFEFTLDLGIMAVPAGYRHENCLALFHKEHPRWFDEEISQRHFTQPTRVLKSGDKLWVRVVRQLVDKTTYKERMAFLIRHKGILVGAQGAALVLEQKRSLLPVGPVYLSFDERDRLALVMPRNFDVSSECRANGGYTYVPGVYKSSPAGVYLGLHPSWCDFEKSHAFLCFCDPADKKAD